MGRRVECSANTLDHKESEISRLMDEIHQLKDSVDSQRLVLEEVQAQRQRCQDMEMSLAARSAAQPVDQVRSDAPPPPAFSAQLLSMMEALQDLSTRMSAVEDAQEIHVDQVQSQNSSVFSVSAFWSSSKTTFFSSTCRIRGARVLMVEMVLTVKMKN